MNKYIFSYDGSPEHPFRDGYVLVKAKNWQQAIALYRKAYPSKRKEASVSPNANIQCAHLLQVEHLKELAGATCHRIIEGTEW